MAHYPQYGYPPAGGAAGQQEAWKRQVDSLYQYFGQMVKAVAHDCFDVPFRVNGVAVNFTLRVILPARFPLDRPTLQLWPQLPHQALADGSGHVHPNAVAKLAAWNPAESLGAVVQAAVAMFQANPPRAPGAPAAAPVPMHHSVSAPSMVAAQPQPGPPRTVSSPAPAQTRPAPAPAPAAAADAGKKGRVALPPVPDKFPELERLSEDELRSLLADEKEMDAFFSKLECLRGLDKVLQDLRGENAEIARKNIALGQKLAQKQEESCGRQRELEDALRRVDDKAAEYEALISRMTPQQLGLKLDKAMAEAEQQSDELTERFVDGQLPLEDFLKAFLPLRERYHSLAAKRESVTLSLKVEARG